MSVRLARRAMGTIFEVLLSGDDGDETIAEGALALVDRIEDQLSIFLPTSEVSAINAAPGPVKVEPRLFSLLLRMRTLRERTNNAFDGGIASTQFGAVDERGCGTVQANRLDLGGIGKGYAIDRGVTVLKANGIRHFFLNAGGDIHVSGTREAGTPWRVGIRHPRARVHDPMFG